MAEEEENSTTNIMFPPRGDLGTLITHNFHVLSHCILLEEDGSGGTWALRTTGREKVTPEKRGRCQEVFAYQL